MSWFKDILSGGLDKVITSVGTAVDSIVTSDEEKLILKNELIKIQAAADLEKDKIDLQYNQELSKRHQTDMQSDDVWSKRIRPVSLAFLILVVTILSLTDGNIRIDDYVFTIKPEYVDLYKSLLIAAFTFYFGGRSIEKIHKIKAKKEANNGNGNR